ncbi:MAG: tRNA-specific adenosine deaminase [Desulfobulbaceae bacterium A2]|nr:MAG: tRNA-specific adenosine deaminase [Desulfobulbaceae bacterium A2]
MSDDDRFMELALVEARAALAVGEFPVGCVLVAGGEVLARGRRCHSGAGHPNELDHAEMVALRRLWETHPGPPAAGLTVYCTLEPCLMCHGALLLSGVCRIVYGYEDVMGGGLNIDLRRLPPLYAGMRVEHAAGLRRADCKALFREFFQKYDYWQGSLIARHTLEGP